MKTKHVPYFIDTTLRDGEQAPGVVFSLSDKIQICRLLDEVGISELEIGTPAMSRSEINEMKELTGMGFNFVTSAWCRALSRDIQDAALTGCDGVHISFPVSDILLKSMNKDRQWVLSTAQELLHEALDRFPFVAVGAQDASRAELSFLKEFIGLVSEIGTHRIRVADTVGILTPTSTGKLFGDILTDYPETWFEFHAHNDLGMANANVLSAFNAGVDCFSLTINGLGERAGNAALEEVVMAFEMGEKVSCGLNTHLFYEMSHYVGQVANRPIAVSKPVTGGLALSHESGIHTNSILKNRQSYQLIRAEQIGREEMPFVFGKHSGKNSIMHFFGNMEIDLSPALGNIILEKVRLQSIESKRALSEIEVMDIYNHELHARAETLTSSPVVLMRTSLWQIEEDWVRS